MLVVISGAFVWYIYQYSHNPLTHLKILPQYLAHDIFVKRFGQQGGIQSYLKAAKVTYYKDKDKLIFTKPDLLLYNGQQPWHINAESAVTSSNLKIINLFGNVKLEQAAGKKNDATSIFTSELTIDTQNRTASTEANVKIVQIGQNNTKSIIEAKGASVNQKTGEVLLKSSTKEYFMPGK